MILAAAVILAQLADLLTWAAMPRYAEANPVVRSLHDPGAVAVKVLLVVLVLALQVPLRPRYAAVADLLAVVAIAAGAFGAGSNVVWLG